MFGTNLTLKADAQLYHITNTEYYLFWKVDDPLLLALYYSLKVRPYQMYLRFVKFTYLEVTQ